MDRRCWGVFAGVVIFVGGVLSGVAFDQPALSVVGGMLAVGVAGTLIKLLRREE